MQPALRSLPDILASLLLRRLTPRRLPPTGINWLTTTPGGYFEGSANLAPFIRWSVNGVLYPAAAYWDLYDRLRLIMGLVLLGWPRGP